MQLNQNLKHSSPDQLVTFSEVMSHFLVFFRIITLIGYEPNEVIGKTAYYFHNPLDAPRVSDCHSNRKYIFFLLLQPYL